MSPKHARTSQCHHCCVYWDSSRKCVWEIRRKQNKNFRLPGWIHIGPKTKPTPTTLNTKPKMLIKSKFQPHASKPHLRGQSRALLRESGVRLTVSRLSTSSPGWELRAFPPSNMVSLRCCHGDGPVSVDYRCVGNLLGVCFLIISLWDTAFLFI